MKPFNLKESQPTTSKFDRKYQERVFVILKRMCKKYGRLPSSFEIKDGIELEGSLPYAGGTYGDVWKAQYGGRLVAVKAMRTFLLQGDTEEAIHESKQVRLFTRLLL